MENDSFRSLAGFLEQACDIDMSGDYAQFRWADFLRAEGVQPPEASDKPKQAGREAARRVRAVASNNPQTARELSELPGAKYLRNCK